MSIMGAILVIALLLLSIHPHAGRQKKQYFTNQGKIFGTYYNIRYEADKDLHEAIMQALLEFDASMSTFNPESTISRLNQGVDTVLDTYFLTMYQTATEVSELTNGAFDITVAPLVNAWGFGFKHKENLTPEKIDSLRQLVDYRRLSLREAADGQHLVNPIAGRGAIDASAIAKGYACDVIADLIKESGAENLLVDIGGEVVLQGVNQEGKPWRVGITKPIDDISGQLNEIQEIIESTDMCMATSGNYRQFYYEGGMRRSHTIDPRTGYPAESDLLSATVVSTTCMRADALATACMVLGSEAGMALIEQLDSTECYLIIAQPGDSIAIRKSSGFPLSASR